jgi:hypothetical protein
LYHNQNTRVIGSSTFVWDGKMQLSVNKKSLIHAKKSDIFTLTDEILDLSIKCKKNQSEILNRMLRIIVNLSELASISSNLILEPELNSFKNDFLGVQAMFVQDERQKIIQMRIENFCVDANSVILQEI